MAGIQKVGCRSGGTRIARRGRRHHRLRRRRRPANCSKMPVGGRVAGKVTGIISNGYNGRSYKGINEEIIWVSIGMGIAIAVLITIALCYIMREKCQQRREYYITA